MQRRRQPACQVHRHQLARPDLGKRRFRHCRGDVQEHAQRLFHQPRPSAAQDRRPRGRGGSSGPRYRPRQHGRPPRAPADGEKRRQDRHSPQESVPPRHPGRPREIRGGPLSRALHDDPHPQNRRRPRPEHEDRRCGISGRRRKGDFLLYSRRPRRLPQAYPYSCRHFQDPRGDEADRCPPGSGPHRRYRSLRPSALLLVVDDPLRLRRHRCRPPAGSLDEPPEARRPMRQAEMLPQLRDRPLCRGCQENASQGCAARD